MQVKESNAVYEGGGRVRKDWGSEAGRELVIAGCGWPGKTLISHSRRALRWLLEAVRLLPAGWGPGL